MYYNPSTASPDPQSSVVRYASLIARDAVGEVWPKIVTPIPGATSQGHGLSIKTTSSFSGVATISSAVTASAGAYPPLSTSTTIPSSSSASIQVHLISIWLSDGLYLLTPPTLPWSTRPAEPILDPDVPSSSFTSTASSKSSVKLPTSPAKPSPIPSSSGTNHFYPTSPTIAGFYGTSSGESRPRTLGPNTKPLFSNIPISAIGPVYYAGAPPDPPVNISPGISILSMSPTGAPSNSSSSSSIPIQHYLTPSMSPGVDGTSNVPSRAESPERGTEVTTSADLTSVASPFHSLGKFAHVARWPSSNSLSAVSISTDPPNTPRNNTSDSVQFTFKNSSFSSSDIQLSTLQSARFPSPPLLGNIAIATKQPTLDPTRESSNSAGEDSITLDPQATPTRHNTNDVTISISKPSNSSASSETIPNQSTSTPSSFDTSKSRTRTHLIWKPIHNSTSKVVQPAVPTPVFNGTIPGTPITKTHVRIQKWGISNYTQSHKPAIASPGPSNVSSESSFTNPTKWPHTVYFFNNLSKPKSIWGNKTGTKIIPVAVVHTTRISPSNASAIPIDLNRIVGPPVSISTAFNSTSALLPPYCNSTRISVPTLKCNTRLRLSTSGTTTHCVPTSAPHPGNRTSIHFPTPKVYCANHKDSSTKTNKPKLLPSFANTTRSSACISTIVSANSTLVSTVSTVGSSNSVVAPANHTLALISGTLKTAVTPTSETTLIHTPTCNSKGIVKTEQSSTEMCFHTPSRSTPGDIIKGSTIHGVVESRTSCPESDTTTGIIYSTITYAKPSCSMNSLQPLATCTNPRTRSQASHHVHDPSTTGTSSHSRLPTTKPGTKTTSCSHCLGVSQPPKQTLSPWFTPPSELRTTGSKIGYGANTCVWTNLPGEVPITTIFSTTILASHHLCDPIPKPCKETPNPHNHFSCSLLAEPSSTLSSQDIHFVPSPTPHLASSIYLSGSIFPITSALLTVSAVPTAPMFPYPCQLWKSNETQKEQLEKLFRVFQIGRWTEYFINRGPCDTQTSRWQRVKDILPKKVQELFKIGEANFYHEEGSFVYYAKLTEEHAIMPVLLEGGHYIEVPNHAGCRHCGEIANAVLSKCEEFCKPAVKKLTINQFQDVLVKFSWSHKFKIGKANFNEMATAPLTFTPSVYMGTKQLEPIQTLKPSHEVSSIKIVEAPVNIISQLSSKMENTLKVTAVAITKTLPCEHCEGGKPETVIIHETNTMPGLGKTIVHTLSCPKKTHVQTVGGWKETIIKTIDDGCKETDTYTIPRPKETIVQATLTPPVPSSMPVAINVPLNVPLESETIWPSAPQPEAPIPEISGPQPPHLERPTPLSIQPTSPVPDHSSPYNQLPSASKPEKPAPSPTHSKPLPAPALPAPGENGSNYQPPNTSGTPTAPPSSVPPVPSNDNPNSNAINPPTHSSHPVPLEPSNNSPNVQPPSTLGASLSSATALSRLSQAVGGPSTKSVWPDKPFMTTTASLDHGHNLHTSIATSAGLNSPNPYSITTSAVSLSSFTGDAASTSTLIPTKSLSGTSTKVSNPTDEAKYGASSSIRASKSMLVCVAVSFVAVLV